MKGIVTRATTAELLKDPGDCPVPLEMIPNQMGINLVSLEAVSWTRQPDGQLVTVSLHFTPEAP